MKLEMTVGFVAMLLVVTITALPVSERESFPDNVEYFTLTFENGTEITASSDKFPALYNQFTEVFSALPRHAEILDKATEKLDQSLSRLEKEGASGYEISLAAANIMGDMYEELFAEAGMKLKIYNRQPGFLA